MQINDVSATNLRQNFFAKDILVVRLIQCWCVNSNVGVQEHLKIITKLSSCNFKNVSIGLTDQTIFK